MNIDKMTLDECRDYIAERTGWERKVWDNSDLHAIKYRWRPVGTDNYWLAEHPVAPTIDAIAASLPTTTVPHFWWHLVSCLSRTEKESWEAIVGKGPTELCDTRTLYGSEGNTEILARARAACFAWLVLSQESPK